MTSADKRLEDSLIEAGCRLFSPPSDTEELLILLDDFQLLDAELVDPGEGGGTRKERDQRPKRAPAALSGIVPDVIENEYLKPCPGRMRGCDADLQNKHYSAKEDEEFWCSMLGEDSELGLGVIRDVLDECGSNVEKLPQKYSCIVQEQDC